MGDWGNERWVSENHTGAGCMVLIKKMCAKMKHMLAESLGSEVLDNKTLKVFPVL